MNTLSKWNSPDGGPLGTRKLGLLAGAFEDGSLSIFIVPDPDDVQLNGGPIYCICYSSTYNKFKLTISSQS